MGDYPVEAIDRATVIEFLLLAFGIAWLAAGGLYLADIEFATLTGIVLVVVFYMWAPAVAAIVVVWRRSKSVRSATGLRRGNLGWVAIGWITPVALLGLAIGIGTLLPGVEFTTDYAVFLREFGLPEDQIAVTMAELEALPVPPIVLFLLQGLVAGATINALAAMGEELGWRGLLLAELAPWGFWKISVFTGFVWGIWHAPIILMGHNFPDAPVAGVAMMTGATIAMAPIYTYLTVRARSVLAAIFLHGSFNGLAGLSYVYLTGASTLVVSSVGLVGIGAGLLVTAGCVIHDRTVATETITTGAPLEL